MSKNEIILGIKNLKKKTNEFTHSERENKIRKIRKKILTLDNAHTEIQQRKLFPFGYLFPFCAFNVHCAHERTVILKNKSSHFNRRFLIYSLNWLFTEHNPINPSFFFVSFTTTNTVNRYTNDLMKLAIQIHWK